MGETKSPAINRELVHARARQMWEETNAGFPRFVQQRWEQGTQLARDATLIRALHELYPHTAVK